MKANHMQSASYSQHLSVYDDYPASGVRECRRTSASSMVEHLGSPHPIADDDAAPRAYLINAGAPNSTSYRFIAPRMGRRR